MDDLQARLDRAITEARAACLTPGTAFGHPLVKTGHQLAGELDHYAALVALRARYEEFALRWGCTCVPDVRCDWCIRKGELTAEAERLLGEDA